MVTFKPHRYFIGMWYLELPRHLTMHAHGGNFMMVLFQDTDIDAADCWHMVSRHRHYSGAPDTPWERMKSSDTFKWLEGSRRGISEQEITAETNAMFDKLAAVAGRKPEFFEIRGEFDRFNELIANGRAPAWLHVVDLPGETAG